MMERSQRNAGRAPDAPKTFQDLVIAAAEITGEIILERKGRHIIQKPSGKGGAAGYFRSMDVICPVEFQTFVRQTFRYALDGDNVGAVYQTLAEPDAIRPTLYEFCAMWLKGEIISQSRSPPLTKAQTKRRVNELLNDLDRGPASVDLRGWSG
jgi:hypothetical protein